MPATIQLEVSPLAREHLAGVRALRLAPGQSAYLGDVAGSLAEAAADPDSDAMAILGDGMVIGGYRLDYRPTVVCRAPIAGACVVLRAFMLDRRWQGRRLAARAIAACCADLGRRRPGYRLLALNVDCGNVVAVRAYRNAGFVDTGELYRGGRAGPQRLMLRRLDRVHVAESRP